LTDDERIQLLMQEKKRLEAELAKIVKELRMLVTKI
jgi:uncharacterized small protein (DUF1192 family)